MVRYMFLTVRAITYIENIVLPKIPIVFRPFINFIINAEKIADMIERKLTENKLKLLNEKK